MYTASRDVVLDLSLHMLRIKDATGSAKLPGTWKATGRPTPGSRLQSSLTTYVLARPCVESQAPPHMAGARLCVTAILSHGLETIASPVSSPWRGRVLFQHSRGGLPRHFGLDNISSLENSTSPRNTPRQTGMTEWPDETMTRAMPTSRSSVNAVALCQPRVTNQRLSTVCFKLKTAHFPTQWSEQHCKTPRASIPRRR